MANETRNNEDLSRRDFIRLSSGLLTACGAAGIIGCGGGGGSSSGSKGGGGTTVGTIPDATRLAVMNGAAQVLGGLAHTNFPADAIKIQEYLQSQAIIDATSVASDGNVWAHFTDGLMFGVINNMVPTIPSSKSPQIRRQSSSPAPGRDAELPAGPQANLYYALGQDLAPIGDTVGPWLTSGGYNTTIDDNVQVVDLTNVGASTGIFYINCHGGIYPTKVNKSATARAFRGAATRDLGFAPLPQGYVLSTSTPFNPVTLLLYGQDWTDGLLMPIVALNGSESSGTTSIEPEQVWSFNENFITKYMSFGANSFVFIDACSSFNDMIRDACIAKGASIFVGWSDTIGDSASAKVTKRVFDELLGVNVVAPPTPPLRPFDFPSIYNYLVSLGLDKPDALRPDTQLLYYANPGADLGDFAILTPSISNLVVGGTSAAPYLFIEGSFGTQPASGSYVLIYPNGAPAQGDLPVGGTTLTILSWSPTEIKCALPTTGGDVVVSALGHTSNPRRLTEWKGTLNYAGSGPAEHTESFTMKLHILADIESYRTQIDQQLTGPNALLVSAPFFTLPDAECTFTNSGNYTGKYQNWSWTGGGSVPPGANPGFSYSGTLDPVGLTMDLAFAVLTTNDVTVDYKDASGNITSSATGALSMDVNIDFPNNQASPGQIQFKLSANLDIMAGTKNDSFNVSFDGGTATTTTSLSWAAIPVTAGTAPSATAARSARLSSSK